LKNYNGALPVYLDSDLLMFWHHAYMYIQPDNQTAMVHAWCS